MQKMNLNTFMSACLQSCYYFIWFCYYYFLEELCPLYTIHLASRVTGTTSMACKCNKGSQLLHRLVITNCNLVKAPLRHWIGACLSLFVFLRNSSHLIVLAKWSIFCLHVSNAPSCFFILCLVCISKRTHTAFCLHKEASSCFLVFGLVGKSKREGLEKERFHFAVDLLKCENVSSLILLAGVKNVIDPLVLD